MYTTVLVNRSMGRLPFEVVMGIYPTHGPIDLVPLLMETCSVIMPTAKAFPKHMHDFHEDVRSQIAFSNEKYKGHMDSYRRYVSSIEGDLVMVQLPHEWFCNSKVQKTATMKHLSIQDRQEDPF